MRVFSKTVPFLNEGTMLLALTKPSRDLDDTLKKHIVADITYSRDGQISFSNEDSFVPIMIDEPLEITFSVSESGRIHQKLNSCICSSPSISEQRFRSLNDALQQISSIYEKYRASRGGKVYDYLYFFDKDEIWKPLELHREAVYRPHAAVVEQWTKQYVKPHYDTEQYYEVLLQNKEELIRTLKTQTRDLETQVKELNEIFQRSKITVYKQVLDEFRQRLGQNLPETSGNNSWQQWIYKNYWLFGSHYRLPIEKEQVGFSSIPDFLFPTLDGFVDFLEIKRPTHNVIEASNSHTGAYRWSRQANEAIGQSVQYLSEIEKNYHKIAERIEDRYKLRLNTIKPRATILISNSDTWSREQREALRKLNHSLHSIEVLTYSDLLMRGESLIRLFEEKAG
jgi:hypothetical protein